MAETKLTKQIKLAAHGYRPKMPTKMRTIRFADEVWTPHGICDVIRAEDYIKSREQSCLLLRTESLGKMWVNYITNQGFEMGRCKFEGETCPNQNCAHCQFRLVNLAVVDMMITAYEVKITKSDFYSEHGHSIDYAETPFANENYYCLPKDIVAQVEKDIPPHCGILAWTGQGLRKVRDAKWLEVDESVKTQILYTMLKKWCDGVQQRYVETSA